MITKDQVIEKMVEVVPVGGIDGFKKIIETLTRIGIPNRDEYILNQSAHILQRQGKYYICHFKELFALDGLRNDLSEADIARRNRIVQMLKDWGLIEIVSDQPLEPIGKPNMVFVIKHSDKGMWTLRPKYTIGVKKNRYGS